ncbi:bifunctional UDP-N-acetylglucosamine diphosphorylase/glucosamine-1-phosphate N-acetyltransferase GlmU [Caldibacillus thermoamylovorans]|jgi:bifunctional UDP-N-acetylglucosamine pyrophosphorylase/glucosamine-1-phosphate N-acetyltransferase|uniref:Bifunctional protein GlmU n=1 Tax=Caldibacillus thermoamylovorans TaxID=35841 RepID=A0ABD4A9M7_9BACI|nr:bifunctional UDP-N-acetylglucosamine diphosphorylase/glucosamine-1-phosphate N-acetyltransferase GlmU [Caldibacillus thermoamylovorans]MCB5935399.1 bifunctional UDP-N-acetylglucosamine diphosphorylase/glucosamine-1-phosphate N-acetyltransferase GlmU [Bacillus sp. DFI.2.34]NWN96719.1 bifunctional UDP-N-acetylglucosamine diphosphorylase/glucosamine-1-phosphate N-acetyltransferase GlmU [Bacillus sp. (in: firmicutes)]AWI10777.1 bifunctional UDP-N-acetylglucosamine diphosphorylase/glucosamine-1-ph
MSKKYVIVLAAGQGTRMKSKLYKVLHPVCGKPMVRHVIDELKQIGADQIITVVGHGADEVKNELKDDSEFVLQEQQLGTAHAVMQARDLLQDKEGLTLVVCGDTPLLKADTIKAMIDYHINNHSKATILTAVAEDPTGYGRVIRNEQGYVEKIVEHKDASDEEKAVKEINAGTYCFDNASLFHALQKVTNNNAQNEYYLPDVIGILKDAGQTVTAFTTNDFTEIFGINDRVALAQAGKIMQQRINEKHMRNGVTIIDPEQTYIDASVVIGQDTVIYPGTMVKGNTVIGTDCIIGPNSEILNCDIGNRTSIRQSVTHDSKIGSDVQIGPFAHIRPQSLIHDEVRIGNFVEIKKTEFGRKSKASHLSYIGDANVGSNVNIGCGSITVNYDGVNKFKTIIKDGAFIGCNSNLVAPVEIGEGAYVAAGSTITDNVPGDSLSIARARQVNKENYVKNRMKKG